MYHNLEAEIARNEIKRKDVAEALGISEKTLYNKIHGESEFSISECLTIKDMFFPELELEQLFKKGK